MARTSYISMSSLCTRSTHRFGSFIVLAHWNNSLWGDMSYHSDTFWFWAKQSLYLLLNTREAANTNFIVFSLTSSGLKPTIYHTQEHANYYTKVQPLWLPWHYITIYHTFLLKVPRNVYNSWWSVEIKEAHHSRLWYVIYCHINSHYDDLPIS